MLNPVEAAEKWSLEDTSNSLLIEQMIDLRHTAGDRSKRGRNSGRKSTKVNGDGHRLCGGHFMGTKPGGK